MRVREMLKVTKCVRVNSFVGALINMVGICELKFTTGPGSKTNCVKISWWSDSALKSYYRKTVLHRHEIHSSSVTRFYLLIWSDDYETRIVCVKSNKKHVWVLNFFYFS